MPKSTISVRLQATMQSDSWFAVIRAFWLVYGDYGGNYVSMQKDYKESVAAGIVYW